MTETSRTLERIVRFAVPPFPLKLDSLFRQTDLVRLVRILRDSGEVGRFNGFGMVIAQDPAPTGEGVLAELAGLLVLAQFPQDGGKVVSRDQCEGVVVAEGLTVAGEGVLAELA